jgi:Fe2+ or Zn2+ uptake regulation protein
MDLPQVQVPQELCGTVENATGGVVSECQLTFTGQCQACSQAKKGA